MVCLTPEHKTSDNEIASGLRQFEIFLKKRTRTNYVLDASKLIISLTSGRLLIRYCPPFLRMYKLQCMDIVEKRIHCKCLNRFGSYRIQSPRLARSLAMVIKAAF